MRPPAGDRTRDGLLVGLSVASGAVDAISWLALGKVFSAFMTGNLAFLGFTFAGAGGPTATRVLAAIGAFALGAALAARIVGSAPPAGPWPRPVTTVLGLVAVLEAVFLSLWLAADAHPTGVGAVALLAVSAAAMGMQTVATFSLGVRASFTTAATATIAVLMGDLAGWSMSRSERLRLAAVIGGVVVGATAGALLVVHAPSWAPVLPLAVTAGVVGTASAAFGGRHA